MNALLADLERRLSETRADPIIARLDADAADRLEAEVARLTDMQRDLLSKFGTPHQTEM
jgi:vacuolar-type H+-ATPase subunit E/Vma4